MLYKLINKYIKHKTIVTRSLRIGFSLLHKIDLRSTVFLLTDINKIMIKMGLKF